MTPAATSSRQGSFVERVLDGAVRMDAFAAEVAAWEAGPRSTPLHVALGLDAQELLQVAQCPDALRYILHARRFGFALPGPLDSQERVRAYAAQLAAEDVDPLELAAIDTWQRQLDARPDCEPAHA